LRLVLLALPIMSRRQSPGSLAQTAAYVSFGLSIAFLALLAVLHVLEPEFNRGHLISEYQLGEDGFLMSLAFCLLGAGAVLLALSLGPRLRTRSGRAGCWGLFVVGTAFFTGGVFPPVQVPVVIGYLHGISGLVAIFGTPMAITLIERSLARSDAPLPSPRSVRWATVAAWGGFLTFLASLVVPGLIGQMETPLPSWVSVANRLLVVTYCIWFAVTALVATRLPETSNDPQPGGRRRLKPWPWTADK
jgi:hypothetical protein